MSSRLKNFFNILPYQGLIMLFFGCSGLEKSEKEKMRKMNAKGEYIHRNHDEFHYKIESPKPREKDQYPWEETTVGNQTRITKEFFRCRGSPQNTPIEQEMVHKNDCGGAEQHSLPLKNGKEFIYPILMELVNYIQEKTGKKVMITCGHRCPAHNAYADDSLAARTSKHMIGAEVDFYVKGMEWNPERIVNVIMQFYKENPKYKEDVKYQEFARDDKTDKSISTPMWVNREIAVKIFKQDEGRDFDNQHSYPYLCIQVRFDREAKEKVLYTWPKAFNGYLRY